MPADDAADQDTTADGGFTWDVTDEAQKARYFWPKAWVMDWWAEPWDWDGLGTEAGREACGVWKYEVPFHLPALHRAQDGQALFGEPAATPDAGDGTAAQRLRDALAARGHAWLTEFAGRKWDPFHLPLFDPTDGTLSPKHPARAGEGGWDQAVRDLFAAAVRERMSAEYDPRTGAALPEPRGLENPAGLRGVVLLPGMDFSAEKENSSVAKEGGNRNGENKCAEHQEQQVLHIDFSHAMIATYVCLDHQIFGRRKSEVLKDWPESQESRYVFPALQFDRARIGTDVWLLGAIVGGDARFEGAMFGGLADFNKIQISGNAQFGYVWIGKKASFDRARIGRDTCFKFATIRGHAQFSNTHIGGHGQFANACIRGDVGFANASIEGNIQFERTQIGKDGSFDDAQIGGRAVFELARIGRNAHFRGARIGMIAHFRGARIGGDAWFWGARIGGDAWFGGARIGGHAGFDVARIGGIAWFGGARIGGDAGFGGARIGGHAGFRGAVFCGTADFSLGNRPPDDTRIEDSDEIDAGKPAAEGWHGTLASDESRQSLWLAPRDKEWQYDARFNEMNFSGAVFLGPASFADRLFDKRVTFETAFFAVAPSFHQAVFHRDTSFLKTDFFAAPGADQKTVEKRLRPLRDKALEEIDDTEEREEETKFWAAAEAAYVKQLSRRIAEEDTAFKRIRKFLGKVIRRATSWLRALTHRLLSRMLGRIRRLCAYLRPLWTYLGRLVSFFLPKRGGQDVRDSTAAEFERAYQTLKIAMEENRARADEQRFFAFELRSRRKRRDRDVTVLERLFSRLYSLTSGYGRFIWRPLAFLFAGVPAGLALAYWLSLTTWLGGPGFDAGAVRFIWFLYEPALNPLAGIRLERLDLDTNAGPTDWRELWLFFLGGLHRLLNVVLLFLTALVIRRRFQIT